MSNADVQRFVNDTFYIMEDLAKLSHVEVFENRVKVVTKLVKNLQFEYFKDLKKNTLELHIAHNEGNYFCSSDQMKQIEVNEQIGLLYCNKKGIVNEENNPNGSSKNIAGVGVATIGIVTFGGTYETVRPNDKILSPTNNSVALTEIGGNNIIAIDVAQETVAIGTIGSAPQYNFSNV